MTRLAALILLLVPTAIHAQAPLSGLGQAKDGDSLMVGTTEVRLFGIDAPEWDQSCTRGGQAYACGSEAADQLSRMVTGRQVTCVAQGVDQYQRLLGRCTVGATDINQAMVASGHALAFRRYSNDYVAAEEAAKAARRGLWAGEFAMPWDYRRGGRPETPVARARPRSSPAPSASDWAGRARGNCNIKGNRNRRGEWIYHLPGMPYYDQTRPEELFCSEAQAQAAGYRRAKVR